MNFTFQGVALFGGLPLWIWITIKTSTAHVKRMSTKLTRWEFLLTAYASLLHVIIILRNERFGGQISLNWSKIDLWLASKVASQFSGGLHQLKVFHLMLLRFHCQWRSQHCFLRSFCKATAIKHDLHRRKTQLLNLLFCQSQNCGRNDPFTCKLTYKLFRWSSLKMSSVSRRLERGMTFSVFQALPDFL